MPIRVGLLAVVLASTLPATLVAIRAVYDSYEVLRNRVYESTIVLARTIAADIDRELEGIGAGLRVLASSPDLARGDLNSFYKRALDASKLQGVEGYVLADLQGNAILDTHQRYLPSRSIKRTMPPLPEHRDNLTTVMRLPADPEHGAAPVAIAVPVFLDGEQRYTLYADLHNGRLGEIMRRHAISSGWIVAMADTDSVIVGRNRDEGLYLGQQATPAIADIMHTRREGTLSRGRTKDGIPVLTGFTHINTAPWAVIVGAPAEALTAAVQRDILRVSIIGLLTVLLGLGLAYLFARRIEKSVGSLLEPALALGSSRYAEAAGPRFKETAAVADALERAAQSLAHARQLAYYDPLTELRNRNLFEELARLAIAGAPRSGASLALLAVDLDHFKAVNDTHGHAAGDTVLRQAAARMAGAIRKSDVAARYGGDEFMILLDGAGPAAAKTVADMLVAALGAPYPGIAPAVSASIGIAVFPQSGTTFEELVAKADAALYAAKAQGRSRAFCDPAAMQSGAALAGRPA
ncbi:sensor domain-containing diguanylate cyclase [Pigmentiphaga humi]|uniref:sensor domain-containing diguanylate cyclase n=1 Tax=Pigmentiphaga humi TaxID=2478468 RepID=UPI00135873DB|nr:sensor domain-containing diguanylate cyclase [Pigmentiphaga humi]